ncbi:MAG TPA: right-handed parallel beta-helix repeat-containing protein [Anaerolineales bacterium]|nr:right-handed parallel beta-helix repeat-containing protein [Anaerolineales bacterium]
MSRKIFLNLVLWMVCLLSWNRVHAEPTASFTVNSQLDISDFSPGNGVCDAYVSIFPPVIVCTLRAAIEEANANGNVTPDSIGFSPAVAGAVFTLDDSLGGLVLSGNNIFLNGTSLNNETISGAGFTSAFDPLLTITGSNNAVQNLIFRSAPSNAIYIGASATASADSNYLSYLKIVGSGADGVQIAGVGGHWATNNTINSSSFGLLNLVATACQPTERNRVGVDLRGGSENTTIYSSDFFCQSSDGIVLSNTYGNTITLSRIGVGGLTNQVIGNQGNGILIDESTNTTITSNIIGGNAGYGINIANSNTVNIRTNKIGVHSDGVTDFGNGYSGILAYFVDYLTVGGDSSTDFNIISGNSIYGINIAGGNYASIVGNIIGLNSTVNVGVGNGWGGIYANGASHLSVGSSLAYGPMQYIGGNGGGGVTWEYVQNSTLSTRNYIGGNAGATSGLGNVGYGISLFNSINNDIRPGDVRDNAGVGIGVLGNSAGNFIEPLKFSGNLGLPIDLAEDGHTPNDGGDGDSGPNALQNYPVITSRTATTINGTACAFCRVSLYVVQSSSTLSPFVTGSFLAYVYADAAGNWSYTSASLPAVVSLVGMDTGLFNSSELSPATVRNVFLPVVLR